MSNKIKQILSFLHQAEKLKTVLRHSWLSNGRRESTAEHIWRMALMAMLFYKHLQKNNLPNLEKVFKMVLVHDLTEIYAGDVPAWKKGKATRYKEEKNALQKLINPLSKTEQSDLMSLWEEF